MRYLILLTAAFPFMPGSLRAQLSEPPTGITEGVKEMTHTCPSNPQLGNLDATPAWSGWGAGERNARFETKAASGLAPADVPKLKLKWAYGFPGAASMYSQPAVAFGRVFVGDDKGIVY